MSPLISRVGSSFGFGRGASAAAPAAALYSFTSFTFTNGGATGRNGPTSFAADSSYTSQPWYSTYFSVASGIQNWTAPATGNYLIRAAGAAGEGGGWMRGAAGGAGQ